LKQAGYDQYEISNFARPGRESRHNSTYWRNQSYYGLGAGAHGYMNGKRHVNAKGIMEYIEATKPGLPYTEIHEVSREEAMEDFMMVGLRLMDGVRNEDFREQFGVELEEVFGATLDRLLAQNLLTQSNGGYRLTDTGIFLGNEAFAEFVGILS
jgi:coproporphyrinogen III oxidase-like Fe-S oxidoreductase